MNVEELLGIKNTGLKDYEVVGKLKEANLKRLDEVSFILTGGRKVIIKLNKLDQESIMDDSWWVRN